jgi:hypothetical protein
VPQLYYFDNTSQSWLPAVYGAQGSQGAAGAQGAQGAAGTNGVNAVNVVLNSPLESTSLSTTVSLGSTGNTTVPLYVTTNGSFYVWTAQATNNWTFNIASTSSATLNSLLSIGQSITIAAYVNQGGTAYYCLNVNIDGVTQNAFWQGGYAPTAGNANGYDAYAFTIVKTSATPTYTVFASLTRY